VCTAIDDRALAVASVLAVAVIVSSARETSC
jgi:hypothetical protein